MTGSRWLARTALFASVAITACFLVRDFWAWRHLRPRFQVTAELAIETPEHSWPDQAAPLAAFLEGRRVRAIGGEAVLDRESYRRQLRRQRPPCMRIELAESSPTDPVTVLLCRSSRRPALAVNERLQLRETRPGQLALLGIGEGERLQRLNGVAIASPADFRAIERGAPSELIRYTLDPTVEGDPPLEVLVEGVDWPVAWILTLVGAGFFAIGWASYRLRPDSRSATALLSFCLWFGLFYLLRSLPFASKTAAERHLFLVVWTFAPVPVVFLLFTFTPLRRLAGARRPTMIAAALCLALYGADLLRWSASFRNGMLATPLALTWFVGSLAILLAALPVESVLRLSGRRATASEHQRGRALRIASLAAFAPPVLYAITRIVSGDRFGDLRIWFELPALLFPLILGYATVRYDLFQVGELMREGIVYGLLLAGAALTYALVVAGVIPVIESFVPDAAPWITTLVVAGAVLAASPAHRRVRHTIDRRFSPATLDVETLLATLPFPRAGSITLRDYCEALCARVAALVRTDRVSFLVRHPPTENWLLAAATGLPQQPLRIEDCEPFLRLVAASPGKLTREEVFERRDLTRHPRAAVVGMDLLGAAVALPLVVAGELWGLLAVGDKASRTNYTGHEIDVLRQLARECSVGLYKYQQRLLGSDASPGPIAREYPEVPERIGPYRIEKLLGEGAMGLVYLGHRDGRAVAIKVANQRVQSDPKLRKRFQREVDILSQLDHPHVVRLLGASRDDHEPYLVLDYFPDGSLRDLLSRRGRLPESEAVRLAGEMALALEAALAQGIVHRDLNPRNVFLTSSGSAKVGDFGIAHVDDETTITTQAQMLGTPGYLSPEACRGVEIDWRADLYALGVTLYEMLAGHRPFRGRSLVELIALHVNGPVPNIRDESREVSARTAEALRRMLAKSPADRQASYRELLAELGVAAS